MKRKRFQILIVLTMIINLTMVSLSVNRGYQNTMFSICEYDDSIIDEVEPLSVSKGINGLTP